MDLTFGLETHPHPSLQTVDDRKAFAASELSDVDVHIMRVDRF